MSEPDTVRTVAIGLVDARGRTTWGRLPGLLADAHELAESAGR